MICEEYDIYMKEELISIVVPVYNTEKYLEECIESILRQTYKKLEIILVDDGSTDSSGIICDYYAKQDARIRVIHQANGGQQAARSRGIEAAHGRYIGFVDSDDWIDCDMFECLYHSIEESDLVTSGVWIDDQLKMFDMFCPGIYESKDPHFCNNLIFSQRKDRNGSVSGLLNNVYCKLFRLSVVKQCYRIADAGLRIAEDLLFTLVYTLTCSKITVTDQCHYHYRNNSTSVMHTKDSNYLIGLNRLYSVLNSLITGHSMEKSLKSQLDRMFMYYIYVTTESAMQIDCDACFPKYLYPENDRLTGRRVILFGAGRVGQSYYRYWQCYCNISVVNWIDNHLSAKKLSGGTVEAPISILQADYDCIVCAVKKKEQAEKMKEQLIKLGVPEEKIFWRLPIDIFSEYYFHLAAKESIE